MKALEQVGQILRRNANPLIRNNKVSFMGRAYKGQRKFPVDRGELERILQELNNYLPELGFVPLYMYLILRQSVVRGLAFLIVTCIPYSMKLKMIWENRLAGFHPNRRCLKVPDASDPAGTTFAIDRTRSDRPACSSAQPDGIVQWI
jgi:hypothetical protein